MVKSKNSSCLAERQLRLLRKLLGTIYISDNLGDALRECLYVIGMDMGWQVGHVYMVSEGNNDTAILPTEFWYFENNNEEKYQNFIDATRSKIFKPDEGIVGRVYSSGWRVWIDDVKKEEDFIRSTIGGSVEVKSGFVFPIKLYDKVLAVMEFFFEKSVEESDFIVNIIESIEAPLSMILSNKKVDDDLKKSEKMLQAIMDNIVDGLVITDEDGEIISFQGGAEKIFGYKSEEVIGKRIEMLMPSNYASEHNKYIKRYVKSKRPKTMGVGRELTAVKKTGEVFPVDIALGSANLEGETVFVALIRDITEREAKQLEISQFKQALDKTLDCVFMFDPESLLFTYVNQGALNHIEYSYDEIMELTPVDLKPEFDKEKFRRILNKLIDGSVPSMNFETVHKSKSGKLIPVDVFLQYIRYDEGGGRFVAISRDISERKNAEKVIKNALEEAERANNAKSDFLARMSHEIRTPMNGVLGTVNLLENTELDKKQAKYVQTIKRSGDNLLVILNEILDYSKIEAGQFTISVEPFGIKDVMEDICQLYSSVAKEKNISLGFKYSDDIAKHVIGDGVRLRQVLLNLVGNAIKFTQKGEIEIVAELDKVINDTNKISVKFSVKDTGCGIPKEVIGDIFEAFSQADTSTVRKAGGTGLGLPICKSIIEMMGGKIDVISEENVGSEFFFSLDFEICSESDVVKVDIADDEYKNVKFEASVLVSEDMETNRFIVSEMLKSMGCSVEIAVNGEEAVEKVLEKKGNYDLVLMDMHMPVMDGRAALKEIKKDFPNLPIVALTANVLIGEREKCIKEGFSGFLGKPLRSEDVVNEFIKVGLKTSTNSKNNKESNEFVFDDFVTLDTEFLKQYSVAAVKVISLMIKDSDNIIDVMSKSIENGDIEEVKISAHSMKSISASVGGKKLSQMSKIMEDMAKKSEFDSLKEFVPIYMAEYKKLRAKLLEYQV